MAKAPKSLAEKKAELHAQLKELEALEKAERAEKCAVIGNAVYDAMEKNPEIRASIRPILEKYVTGKKARTLLELDAI